MQAGFRLDEHHSNIIWQVYDAWGKCMGGQDSRSNLAEIGIGVAHAVVVVRGARWAP